MSRSHALWLVLCLLAAPAVMGQTPPWDKAGESAEVNPSLPVDPVFEKARAGAQVDPQLGVQIPRGLGFLNDDGQPVTIGEFFDGEQPVILTLTYFTCPMLCGKVMNGLVGSLGDLDWRPGYDFKVLNVSIDPRDKPDKALTRKQSHIDVYGRGDETVASGWHYLTGEEANIRVLADSLGFGYTWIDEHGEYAHGAAVFLLTPDGRLARVLAGTDYREGLRPALLEAGDGKIGTLTDRLYFMTCWRWDPVTGQYLNLSMNTMRIGGGLFVLGLVAFIVYLTRSGRRASTAASVPPKSEIEAGLQS